MEFEGNYATANSAFEELKSKGAMPMVKSTFFNRIKDKTYPSIRLGKIILVNIDEMRAVVSKEGNLR